MDDRDLIIAYLAYKDYRCPHCQYNLRSVREAICPECGEALALHPDAITTARIARPVTRVPSKGLFRAAMIGLVMGIPPYIFVWAVGALQNSGGLFGLMMLYAPVVGLVVHPGLAAALYFARASFFRLSTTKAYLLALAAWYWAVLPSLFMLNSMFWGVM